MAGDRSVTLTWTNPNDSSITRYEYQVNHTDTYTGKLSGWSGWADVPGSGASTTTHTFTGLTAGKEYRYKIRVVKEVGEGNDLVSKPAPAAKPWYVAATAGGPTPPPAVGNFWVDRRCDHHFIVWWQLVPGATGYDLEMRGKEWKRLLTNKYKSGFQFSQWTKDGTFKFRIRAVNAHGVSDWRHLKSVAPPCAVAGLQASYAANGDVTVSWNPAKRAESYDVNFSADHGRSWQRMVSNLNATTYTFNKNPQSLPYSPDFLVAVQSLKGGLNSQWRNAGVARIRLTTSNVGATSAALNLAGHSGQWWYDADTGPHTACQGPIAAGTSSADLSGLTANQPYTYQAYSATGCNSGNLLAAIAFTTPTAAELAAQNVTATSATLELSNHTGDWWFKRTAPDAGTCTAGESDFTNDLTGLIPGTEYTYKAYGASSCADTHVSASVDFTTGGVSVSNLDENSAAACTFGNLSDFFTLARKCGIGFTTGNATNGYTLHSVTTKFGNKSGTPTGFTVALHEASGNEPASNAISNATLSGNSPETAGEYTYNCSGSGCQLAKDTTYYVVLSTSDTSGANVYRLETTASTNETRTPSDNGWLIANQGMNHDFGNNTNEWYDATKANKMKVSATVNATLTATVSSGKVTLTLTNGPSDWWFKIGGTGSCTAASGSTVPNIGGYAGGPHSVKAYSDDACSKELAATTFTLPATFTASGISGTGATLTVGGHSGDWYYKGISGTSASTNCVTVSGSTTATLSNLTADNLYGYTAYSGANCTTEIDTEYFSTNDFDVGNLGEAAVSSTFCLVGYYSLLGGSVQCAVAFDTGGRSGGYTLKSVTGRFRDATGSPGNIIVKLHAADSGNSSNPAATAIANATFTGNNPSTAGLYSRLRGDRLLAVEGHQVLRGDVNGRNQRIECVRTGSHEFGRGGGASHRRYGLGDRERGQKQARQQCLGEHLRQPHRPAAHRGGQCRRGRRLAKRRRDGADPRLVQRAGRHASRSRLDHRTRRHRRAQGGRQADPRARRPPCQRGSHPRQPRRRQRRHHPGGGRQHQPRRPVVRRRHPVGRRYRRPHALRLRPGQQGPCPRQGRCLVTQHGPSAWPPTASPCGCRTTRTAWCTPTPSPAPLPPPPRTLTRIGF